MEPRPLTHPEKTDSLHMHWAVVGGISLGSVLCKRITSHHFRILEALNMYKSQSPCLNLPETLTGSMPQPSFTQTKFFWESYYMHFLSHSSS